MFDFIHVLDDKKVLVALGDIAEPDIMGIFIRPFTKNAWAVFFVMITFLLLIIMGFHYMQSWTLQNAQVFHKLSRILIVLTWFCYMLIEIYYEGALTMFFSTKSKNPFENIRDVMRAYPNWKLLMQSGTDIYFLPYVESGDEDYTAFWKRVEENPKDSVYKGFEDTVKERKNDHVILHVSESAVDVLRKKGQSDSHNDLEVFGKRSNEYFGLITTKNSPLGIILQHGSNIMYERGTFSYLKTKWLRNSDTSCGRSISSDKTVVDLKHVNFAFILYGSVLFCCILILAGELYFYKSSRKNDATEFVR